MARVVGDGAFVAVLEDVCVQNEAVEEPRTMYKTLVAMCMQWGGEGLEGSTAPMTAFASDGQAESALRGLGFRAWPSQTLLRWAGRNSPPPLRLHLPRSRE